MISLNFFLVLLNTSQAVKYVLYLNVSVVLVLYLNVSVSAVSALYLTMELLFLGSGDNILEDVAVKERELFISDATDVYPASALRLVNKIVLFLSEVGEFLTQSVSPHPQGL